MSNTLNWNDATVDYGLLEKVNPVFNTAKMTLFQLAANGNTDAAVLVRDMGLTLEATQNSATTKASPEQVLGGTIMLEIRYRTMARLAEESGCIEAAWLFISYLDAQYTKLLTLKASRELRADTT